METFVVSRYTTRRFLEKSHMGRFLSNPVLNAVGKSVEAVDAATWAIKVAQRIIANASRSARNRRAAAPNLFLGQEGALRKLCAARLTTVNEMARFNRVPSTTPRGRSERLTELGLADSVSHRLSALGPKPQRRYFPTKKGLRAAAAFEYGSKSLLADHPVSRQWFRILAERLDAVAALNYVSAMIADADPEGDPVRVAHYCQVPYDQLITLSEGHSVGICARGRHCPRPICATA